MIVKNLKLLSLVLCGLVLGTNTHANYLSPQNFNALYEMAAKGNISSINNAKARGLNIDSLNSDGDTGLCVAAKRHDKKAFRTFLQTGANPSHYCTWNIVGYREFIQSAVKTPTKNINTAVKVEKPKTGMSWKTKALIGTGIVAAGAGTALALSGGGSSYDPNCVHGYYNKQDICVCYKGYSGKKCNECATGYGFYGTNKCHLTLACVNCEQKGDKCVCNTGYGGTLCDICAEGYGRDNKGECVRKTSEKVVGNDFNNNYNEDLVTYVENKEYTDVYGMFYDSAKTPHDYKLEREKLANAHSHPTTRKTIITVMEDGEEQEKEIEYLTVNASRTIEIHNINNDSNVYGLYSNNAQKIYNNYLEINGGGYITNTVPTYELFPSGILSATIDIVSSGDGNVYGIFGRNEIYSGDFKIEGATGGHAVMNSKITIDTVGNGNSYGIYNNSTDGKIYNLAKTDSFATLGSSINVSVTGSGNAYGIYGLGEIENSGNIQAFSSNGNAYGIYTKGGTIINNKDLNEGELVDSIYVETENGTAYGIYSDAGKVENGRYITVEGADGVTYGIYNNKGTVINTSGIDVYSNTDAYGIYNKGGNVENSTQRFEIKVESFNGNAYGIYSDGGTVINSGQIYIVSTKGDNHAFGIFATNRAKVVNTGDFVFNINGSDLNHSMDTSKYCSSSGCKTPAGGYAIYLTNGAKFVNAGSIATTSVLNLGANGVQLANGGNFEATSLSGNLEVSSSVVENGFDNSYVVSNAINANDVSKLNISSESVMFDASINGKDVILSKKDFNKIISDSDVAAFLENNYAAKNNEQLFSELKNQTSISQINKSMDNLTGKNLISHFADEDILMQQNLEFDINERLFNVSENEFSFSENVASNPFNNTNGQTKYAISGQKVGKAHIGVGMAISDLRTDNNNSVRNSQNYQFMVPVQFKDKNFNAIITPKLAYSYGSYSREGFNNTDYKGDIEKQMMSLSAQTKYSFDAFGLNIIPTAETTVSTYRTTINEGSKQFALATDDRTYSATLGFGAFVKKEYENIENQKLNFMAGAMLYHEFANPYKLKMYMNDMNGSFDLTDDNRTDTYAVLRSNFTYDINNISLYGNFLTYIDSEYRSNIDIGFRYSF